MGELIPRAMKKQKKAFKDTIFGKIVGKAGNILTDVPGIVLKAASGNYLGAVADVMGELSASNNPAASGLLNELTLQLKQIELEFAKVELEETKLYLLDTQNARNKEIEIIKSGASNWFQYLAGIFGLILLSFCLYVLVYITVPEPNRDLFVHFLGIIEGIALAIFNYQFGSSKGSKDKTKLLGK
jgi:hypothetical protein